MKLKETLTVFIHYRKDADKASLADFARYALRQICSQEWVRERCLKIPEELCSAENLLDSIVTPRQVWTQQYEKVIEVYIICIMIFWA